MPAALDPMGGGLLLGLDEPELGGGGGGEGRSFLLLLTRRVAGCRSGWTNRSSLAVGLRTWWIVLN